MEMTQQKKIKTYQFFPKTLDRINELTAKINKAQYKENSYQRKIFDYEVINKAIMLGCDILEKDLER